MRIQNSLKNTLQLNICWHPKTEYKHFKLQNSLWSKTTKFLLSTMLSLHLFLFDLEQHLKGTVNPKVNYIPQGHKEHYLMYSVSVGS